MLPVVVCIDVEPDRRLPSAHPTRFLGFEALAARVSTVRAQLARVLERPVHLTWALRMDPHIAAVYGRPTWVAETYRGELEAQRATGDAIGIHPHMWRLEDGGWWSDNADPEWVSHVVTSSLGAFRSSFGEPCRITRCGDRFLSPAVVQELEAAGVVVDLTVEPGLEAVERLAEDEPTRGTLPDTRSAPLTAYRLDATDICAADPTRREALVELPLTPGVEIVPAAAPFFATGSFRILTLWTEPRRFAQQLERRLRAPELSHLAFAIRSDIALLPGSWAAVEANLDHLARTLVGSGAFVTALEAASSLEPVLDDPPRVRPASPLVTRGSTLATLDAGVIEGIDTTSALAAELPVLEWLHSSAMVQCLACGTSGPGDLVARTIPRTGSGVEAIRCRACGAVRITGPHVGLPTVPPHLEDRRVEAYAEQLGAIEVIAATLAAAGKRPPGIRLLDVGCGYGFGLAVANGLWGWEGEGVDPGAAAAVGAEQLGHPLHRVMFDADLQLDGTADVILASEVIEHVADPADLLRVVRHNLADDGVLVLTTPDADAVSPERALGDVLPAVGDGAHVCLFSERALIRALQSAGFMAVRVERRGATLHAVAATEEASLPAVDDVASHELADIAAWAIDRASAAPPASALRLGLAARAARFFLHAAELERAWLARAELAEALDARHGIDLDAPETTAARVEAGEGLPVVVADAHLTSGVLYLHAGDHARAAAHLLAAAEVAADRAGPSPDPSLRWIEAQALGQAAVALARTEPDEVAPTVRRMLRLAPRVTGVIDVDVLTCRAFTELAAAGHHAAAEAMRDLVPLPTPEALQAPGDRRRAALDAAFMRAMLDLHFGRAADAAAGFDDCARLAAASDDDHSRQLVADARAHVQIAAEAGAGRRRRRGKAQSA
jgi:SAM-dependent methyltransferase